MARTQWYKDRVFYQIWPRSFKDGNGDGIGDLWGVYQKLDYLKSLGVGAICFAPLFPSPGVHCGYDISHYTDIAPEYGNIQVFRQVLFGAHERDLKIILELVVNYTSDQHQWFEKSRQRIAPYTDYYIWRPGRADGSQPNNWDSNLGGKAWTWDDVRQEYYLHLFAPQQPELNMDNPLVRNELKRIFRFWLDLGVDGFQLDGLTYLSKKENLPDDYLSLHYKGLPCYNHGPHIHNYLREFHRDVFQYYDCITLAEPPFITPKQALTYIQEGPQQEVDLMFPFQTAGTDWLSAYAAPTPFRPARMKHTFTSWQQKLQGKAWNVLYLENHNRPRAVSYCADQRYRQEFGKMLAACYLFQQGTPFIYQGQEIGMTDWHPEDSATQQIPSLGAFFQMDQIPPDYENIQTTPVASGIEDVSAEEMIENGAEFQVQEPLEDSNNGAPMETVEAHDDVLTEDIIEASEEVPAEEASETGAVMAPEGVIADGEDPLTGKRSQDPDNLDLDADLRWCEEIAMDEDLQWYENDLLFEDSPLFEQVQALLQDRDVDGARDQQPQDPTLWHSPFDFAHSPMQWNEEINAGFTAEKPWFYVNQNYTEINAAQQDEDPDSILNFYRKAIELRRKLSCVRYGDYREFCKSSSKVYIYARQDGRQRILVVCSFSDKLIALRTPRDFHIDTANLILQNYSHIKPNLLQPYEARVYLWK